MSSFGSITDFMLDRRRAGIVSLALAFAVSACDSGKDEHEQKEKRDDEKTIVIDDDPALDEAVERVTGGHTRAVWMWHQNEDNSDTYASGSSHLLVGYDSRDGRGVRVLIGDQGNWAKPLISPEGSRVYFSDKRIERLKSGKKRFDPVIFRMPWGGTAADVEEVGAGFAVDVWRDPANGREWVYAVDDIVPSTAAAMEAEGFFRFPADDPAARESLYDGAISPDNVQVSRDGKRASGLFPWPDGGFIELPEGQSHKLANGCWTSMAPDNSGAVWIFDGAHRNLRMTLPGRDGRWLVDITTAPGIDGRQVYHPRWSSHPLVFAMTGPYGSVDRGENPISKGGQLAEIYIGRFSESLTDVTDWVRLTNNSTGDFFPDVWVAGGDDFALAADGIGPEGSAAAPEPAESAAAWPVETDGSEFLWLLQSAENRIGESGRICRVDANGIARFGRFFEMLVDGGTFTADSQSNAAIWKACQESGELTVEAVVAEEGGDRAGDLSARLLGYLSSKGDELFALYRSGPNLDARIRVGDGEEAFQFTAAHLPAADSAPMSVVIRFKDSTAEFFIDGKLATSVDAPSAGLAGWTDGALVIGDDRVEGTDGWRWRAHVEAVGVYSAALGDDVIAAKHEANTARIEKRGPAPEIVLEAKLVEATHLPDLDDLGAYERALIHHVYEVENVVSGSYSAPRMVVFHWAVLDRKFVAGIPREVGESFRLVVESVADHPELEGERQSVALDDFELGRFVDVTTPTLREDKR